MDGAFQLNCHPEHGLPLRKRERRYLDPSQAAAVGDWLSAIDADTRTPLYELPGCARQSRVGAVFVKDEGQRLGLGSFKALGGAYAVTRLVLDVAARRLPGPLRPAQMFDPEVRRHSAQVTVACATAGNHGRSVAEGARLTGAKAVIFIPAETSPSRVSAIAALGAEIRLVHGGYGEAVEEAAACCAREDWLLVSDTALADRERTPLLVMQGYTRLAQEALEQLTLPPTHIFVQAGVGGLAAALAAHFAARFGETRPRFIVVEPERSACLFWSARAGRPIGLDRTEPTFMKVLDCPRPSHVAWQILCRAADAFMTVGDEEVLALMRRLARPVAGDPAIVSGESGGCGLAGLIRLAADDRLRAAIGLAESSRVLIVNTEGATDPERYQALVGVPAHAVAAHG